MLSQKMKKEASSERKEIFLIFLLNSGFYPVFV